MVTSSLPAFSIFPSNQAVMSDSAMRFLLMGLSMSMSAILKEENTSSLTLNISM